MADAVADEAEFVSLVALAFSETKAAAALEAAAVWELEAAVADAAAAFWDVVADAASTIKDHFALSVFDVNGWDPEDVWAVKQIKILLVDVSLTKSLTS